MTKPREQVIKFKEADPELFNDLLYGVYRSLIDERSQIIHDNGSDYYPLQLVFAIGHMGRAISCIDQYTEEMSDGKGKRRSVETNASKG